MATLGVSYGRDTCRNPSCKSDKISLDPSMGELTCEECGEVLEYGVLDEGAEWRSFGQEGVDKGQAVNSRSRGDGEAEEGVSLRDGTLIGGSDKHSQALQMAQRAMQTSLNIKANLQEEEAHAASVKDKVDKVEALAKSAQNLFLDGRVVRKSQEMMQAMAQKNLLPSRISLPWYCALIHVASRKAEELVLPKQLAMGFASSLGENVEKSAAKIIELVAEVDKAYDQATVEAQPAAAPPSQGQAAAAEDAKASQTKKPALPAAKSTALLQQKKLNQEEAIQEMVRKVVRDLGMKEAVVRHAKDMVTRVYRCSQFMTQSRKIKPTQDTVVAAVLHIIGLLCGEGRPLESVAESAMVQVGQLEETYAALLPHLKMLIPKDMKCVVDPSKLPKPAAERTDDAKRRRTR